MAAWSSVACIGQPAAREDGMNSLLDGILEIKVVAPDPPPANREMALFAQKQGLSPRDGYFSELKRTLDAVPDAVDHQLLAPATMVHRHPTPPLQTLAGRATLVRRFQVKRLPLGTYRILDGMLTGFSYLWPPLLERRLSGPGFSTAALKAPYPALVSKPPFKLTRDVDRTAQPIMDDLVVTVSFSHPVADNQRDGLVAGFATWQRLMIGGLRITHDPRSWSNIGPTETRWLADDRLQWEAEVVMSHGACFDLLTNMLVAWHRAHPIREVTIR